MVSNLNIKTSDIFISSFYPAVERRRPESRDQDIGMRTFLLSAVALGCVLSVAEAEEYPLREPSSHRTVFVESAQKACVRDAGNTGKKTTWFCECKVAGVAALLTAKDLEEMLQCGMHVTPRYQAIADQFDTDCEKLVRGR